MHARVYGYVLMVLPRKLLLLCIRAGIYMQGTFCRQQQRILQMY